MEILKHDIIPQYILLKDAISHCLVMIAAYINKRPEVGHLPTEVKIDHNQP
jgi:hypothetical protein